MRPIVIIGAGLTGLLIAYRLKKEGYAIKVIEARNRIGGRIFTLQSKNDTDVEMGATWFGPPHQNVTRLLRELKLTPYEQFMEGTAFFEPSAITPPQEVEIPRDAPSFRIAGGTSKITSILAENLNSEELLLSQPVKEIHFQDALVSVKTDTLTIEAEKVITTLPPALLTNTIHFKPALPTNLVEIATSTHTWMHDAIKIALIYKTPFWRTQKLSGTVFSNVGPINEFYDHSNSTVSKFALCGFVNTTFAKLPKTEREEKVVNQLYRIFGKVATAYISYEELIWTNEAYTQGSEMNAYPHQNNGHKIYENGWFNNQLIMAGSETSPQFGGYMDGAVYSANRTVEKILNLSVRNK